MSAAPVPLLPLLVIATLAASILQASSAAELDPLMAPPERGFVTRTQAATWEEALITSNGSIGALVMGRPLAETITFSHERLFMPNGHLLPVPQMAPHLEAIRSLLAAGRYREAAQEAARAARAEGYDEMIWTDPLVPAFDLTMTVDRNGELRDVARSVDFQTGVATVRWEDGRGVLLRRVFVSRADHVAVVSLRAPAGESLACRVALKPTPADEPEPDDEDEENDAAPTATPESSHLQADEQGNAAETDSLPPGVAQIDIAAAGDVLTYQSRFAETSLGGTRSHAGVVRVIAVGGGAQARDQAIVVENAREVVLLISLEVNQADSPPDVVAIERRLATLEPDFDHLLRRHVALHGKIFDRVRLDLGGDSDQHRLPTEVLLRESEIGRMSPALLEKQFDASRYAILCASGDLPPTLQGVWTGTWTPPWQSDYTHNGNVPTALASMLMANMPECIEAYFDYMESLLPHFQVNARRLFGARGILVPSRTSSHGYNIHFDEEYIHLFWTPGAAWAAHFFYDYYLYTGDRQFLEQRAYPFMKEAALFYEDFLYEGNDGRWVFNPSYSPENTPANSDSQASINATMDIALVSDLFSNLIEANQTLRADPDDRKRWTDILDKMPDYRIGSGGVLAEWTTPKLLDNHQHRHVSHLVGLFDGLPDKIAHDATLQEAATQVIERRMVARRDAGGGEMSFGLVQMGLAAASLGNAPLAHEAVDLLSDAYWRPNLTTTHNPQSLFNVDICGGMPAVIIKMLVSSEPGSVRLLPALPDSWPTGRIEGILCRGQIEIQSLQWDARRIAVTLVSEVNQQVELAVPSPYKIVQIDNVAIDDPRNPAAERQLIRLPAAQSVTVEAVHR